MEPRECGWARYISTRGISADASRETIRDRGDRRPAGSSSCDHDSSGRRRGFFRQVATHQKPIYAGCRCPRTGPGISLKRALNSESARSPHRATRNAGRAVPDCGAARLHPGYSYSVAGPRCAAISASLMRMRRASRPSAPMLCAVTRAPSISSENSSASISGSVSPALAHRRISASR